MLSDRDGPKVIEPEELSLIESLLKTKVSLLLDPRPTPFRLLLFLPPFRRLRPLRRAPPEGATTTTGRTCLGRLRRRGFRDPLFPLFLLTPPVFINDRAYVG